MNWEIPDVQAGFRQSNQILSFQHPLDRKKRKKTKRQKQTKKKRIPEKNPKIYCPLTERNKAKVEVAQLCLTFCDFYGLYSPWNSPGQNSGVSSLSFLQQIFLIGDQTGVCGIAARFFTNWTIREALSHHWLGWNLWLCGSYQTLENSWRIGNTSSPYLPPGKPICRSRSNRIGYVKMDWFQIGKGEYQGCILSPSSFNLYEEFRLV